MAANEIYGTFAEKLGVPGSKRFIKILEYYFTPQEGQIILQLQGNPMTLKQLANILKLDEKTLAAKLDDLDYRGLITKGKTTYCAPGPKGEGHAHHSLTNFHHLVAGCGLTPYPPSQQMKDLWSDFFWNEWIDIELDSFDFRKKTTGRPGFMVWPATGALDASPKVPKELILKEEDFRNTLKNAKKIAVGPCTCRLEWPKEGVGCGKPLMTCWHIDNAAAGYHLDHPDRTCGIQELTLDQALARLDEGEQAGLVRTGICMCCGDCCHVLTSLAKHGRLQDLIDPSRYRVVLDESRCTGCQTCVEKCNFNAVEMRKTPGSKKLKAAIINENCMGCGVCVLGCKQKALTLEIVRPPAHIFDRPKMKRPGPNLYALE